MEKTKITEQHKQIALVISALINSDKKSFEGEDIKFFQKNLKELGFKADKQSFTFEELLAHYKNNGGDPNAKIFAREEVGLKGKKTIHYDSLMVTLAQSLDSTKPLQEWWTMKRIKTAMNVFTEKKLDAEAYGVPRETKDLIDYSLRHKDQTADTIIASKLGLQLSKEASGARNKNKENIEDLLKKFDKKLDEEHKGDAEKFFAIIAGKEDNVLFFDRNKNNILHFLCTNPYTTQKDLENILSKVSKAFKARNERSEKEPLKEGESMNLRDGVDGTINAKNGHEKTPLDIALKSKKDDSFVTTLLVYGAVPATIAKAKTIAEEIINKSKARKETRKETIKDLLRLENLLLKEDLPETRKKNALLIIKNDPKTTEESEDNLQNSARKFFINYFCCENMEQLTNRSEYVEFARTCLANYGGKNRDEIEQTLGKKLNTMGLSLETTYELYATTAIKEEKPAESISTPVTVGNLKPPLAPTITT